MPDSVNRPVDISQPMPFTSLADLRARHSVLLQRRNSTIEAARPTPSELHQFLVGASQSGRILRDTDSRETAQGIIDFWTAVYLGHPEAAQESLQWSVLHEFVESAVSETAANASVEEENLNSTAQRGDVFIKQCDKKQRALLGALLVRFILLKEGSLEPYAIPVGASDDFPSNAAAKDLLAKLLKLGLVTKSQSGNERPVYSLSHDQLLNKWGFLKELVAQRRAFREMARGWIRSGRPVGGLLNSREQLDLALAFPGLTQNEDEFFDESRKRNEKTRYYQWAAIAAIIAIGGLAYAWFTAYQAKEQMRRAIDRGNSVRAAEVALRFSGEKFRPESFLLAQVVAFSALPTTTNGLVPPRALAVLRYVSRSEFADFEKLGGRINQSSQSPSDQNVTPFDPLGKISEEIGTMACYLPYTLSPDRKLVVTLEEGSKPESRKPVVWNMERFGEYAYDLPETEGEINSIGIDTTTNEFVANAGGKLIAWDLKKRTMRQVPNKRIEDVVVLNRIQKCPSGAFHPYTQIRDKWVYESLTKLKPLEVEQERMLPPGLVLLNVEKIIGAFKLAESGTVDAAAKALNEALGKLVNTSDSLALQAIQWRLLDQGHQKADTDPATAKELYAKAQNIAARLGTKLLSDNDDRNFKEFNDQFTVGLKAIREGKLEVAEASFENAKSKFSHLWEEQVRQWKLPDGQTGTPGEVVRAVRFYGPFGAGMSLSQKGNAAAAAEEFTKAKAVDEALWSMNIQPWVNQDKATPEEFAATVSFMTPFSEGYRAAQSGNRQEALDQFTKARTLNPELWKKNVEQLELSGAATEAELFIAIVAQKPPAKPAKRE